MRRDGEVAGRTDEADWHWGWSYRGDGCADLLHLFRKDSDWHFVGIPPERVDEIAPFSRFGELTKAGSPMKADPQLRAEWSAWVEASSKSHQGDRSHAIPRLIVEQLTGRDASDVEIRAVAKLCNRYDKSHGARTYAVSTAEVQAALDAISVPALF